MVVQPLLMASALKRLVARHERGGIEGCSSQQLPALSAKAGIKQCSMRLGSSVGHVQARE
eukprot:6213981-Pleurochrysis_carterae.AAC.1